MNSANDRFARGAPGSVSGDARAMMLFEANKKSMAVSYILWLFLGALGGHRFYNGRTGTAVTQLMMWVFGLLLVSALGIGLLLLVPLGIWLLVDAFLIPGWVNRHNNALAHELGGG
jgi:TM2 domain-containing membrane protein YozV